MISQRIRGLYSLLAVAQLCLGLGCYWVYYLVYDRYFTELLDPARYLIYCFLFLLGLSVEASHRYYTDPDCFQKSILYQHRIVLRQSFFAAAPVIFFVFATKDQTISRGFLFSFLPLLHILLLFSIWRLPGFLARHIFGDTRLEKTLLVGSKKKAIHLLGWLNQKAELGFETVGLLCNETAEEIPGLPLLGNLSCLEKVIRQHKISQIILVEVPESSQLLQVITATSELLGVRILVKSDLEEKFRHPIVYMENEGLHFFALREEPLENPFNRTLKRLIDVSVSLPVVFFILPITSAIVWIFQRWQSPGPLFYRQDRAGFQNRPFKIIKYRTMHLNNPDVTRQASLNDDRIFPAGKWLRKLSLDELPQFLNVLDDEMSVVGPRPHLQEHNEQFAHVMKNYYIRGAVKPGITGLAQVRGFRGEASDESALRKRIESDIFYLENWSFTADLIIIVRTAWQIIFPPKTAF